MSVGNTLETDRLLLKPSVPEDAGFICKLLNSPKWLQNIGDRGVRTEEDALLYIQDRIRPQFERLGYGNFTVIRKSDGAKMGTCGLYDRDGLDGIDIGFAFLPAFEGKGYALEASRLLKEKAFDEWGLDKILAITTQENVPSQKLLEKLGLRFQGHIRLPQDDTDLLLYQVLKPK